ARNLLAASGFADYDPSRRYLKHCSSAPAMTFAAVLSLDEAKARAVAAALSLDEILSEHPIDLCETAAGRWEIVVYFGGEPMAGERDALDRAVATAIGPSYSGFTITALPE